MKVLVSDLIHEAGLEQLRKFADVEVSTCLSHEELLEKIPDFDAIIVRSGTTVNKEVMDAAKNLKLIVRAGVGLDNIDLDYADKKEIDVENTPEASTAAVSELVFGLMLSWARGIPKADRALREGEWIKSDLNCTELRDKTLGIIGTGRIGLETARKSKVFDMDVLGYDKEERDEFVELGGEYTSLEVLLNNSDYVTLHVPLCEETRHLIDEEELNMMKDSATIINTARGAVINEEALVKALKEGSIAGACLDTYENDPECGHELLELDNVVLTPHLGASTEETQRDVSILAAKKVDVKLLR